MKNLVSLSFLLKSGHFEAHFNQHGCTISKIKTSAAVLTVTLFNSLYCMQLNVAQCSPVAHITTDASKGLGKISTTQIWHSRLGHIGDKKLQMTVRPNLYRHDMPKLATLEFCHSCAKGKIQRAPYSKESAFCATSLLELVRTDLCGPVSTVSFGGSRYFMPIVDDLSRMTFTYFLRKKSEALEVFQQFHYG